MASAPSACLDEDEMLAFVEGRVEDARRRAIVVHLDGCDACRVVAAELARDDANPSPPPERDEEPIVAGRFRTLGVLGRGAMGTVYRAHDEKLGIDVALKRIDRARGAETHAAFTRELKIGRRITHPNVCRLYDAVSDDDFDYLTMELVDGESLADVLARAELPAARALEVLRDVAAGLGAAHALGIVHRDLKPANVLLERATGRAVLTDFGFATDLDAKHSRRLVGTPAYWSPEQARGEAATTASDVYSFGVIAYRLLAGRDFAVSEEDALENVPSNLRAAVARCVALKPSERFRDAREAWAAIDDATKRRGGRRFVSLAVAACAAAGVLWVATRPPHGADEPAAALSSAESATSAVAETPPAPSALPAISVVPIAANSVVTGATSTPTAHPPVIHRAPAASSASSPSPTPAPSASESDILYRR